MSIVRHRDHRSPPRCERVLAVWWLRRDLEPGAARQPLDWSIAMAMTAPERTRELEELIAALDRRVPRVEQAGEAEIARDAAALRAKAVERLAALVSGTGPE